MKATRFINLLPALLLVLAARPVKADTVTWGGGVGDIFQFSNGSSADSSVWFELGTFDGIFAPTTGNYTDWAANWQVFDRATATLGDNQFSPGPPAVLTGLADINPDGTSSKGIAGDLNLTPGHMNELVSFNPNYDFTGKTAYIWAFNDRSLGTGAEWGLYTGTFFGTANAWAFPVADPFCGCLLPVDFNLADVDANVLGGASQGGGLTSLALAPVPEPSGSIFLAAAAIVFILRNRSKLRR